MESYHPDTQLLASECLKKWQNILEISWHDDVLLSAWRNDLLKIMLGFCDPRLLTELLHHHWWAAPLIFDGHCDRRNGLHTHFARQTLRLRWRSPLVWMGLKRAFYFRERFPSEQESKYSNKTFSLKPLNLVKTILKK